MVLYTTTCEQMKVFKRWQLSEQISLELERCLSPHWQGMLSLFHHACYFLKRQNNILYVVVPIPSQKCIKVPPLGVFME